MSEAAKTATDATFQADVLERSHEIPVVLDLWAPWCGPCRQLTPVLEKVAEERPDDFELVKINIDENPKVATELGARSIPLVIGFRDGEPASQFVGVQPEAAVNSFVDALAPSPADLLVKSTANLTDPEAVERTARQALDLDPRHTGAFIALAKAQHEQGRTDEAMETLSRAAAFGGSEEGSRLMAHLRLQAHADVDVDALEERIRHTPADIDARIALGQSLAARGDHEAALTTLIDAVRRDPKYNDGQARQAVVDLFGVLGGAHPLTKTYRPKLAQALF